MDIKKNLSIIMILAWRNVWKNKRRTILTLLTIVVGCAMIIFLNAFAKGGHDQMIEDAVSTNTGHIQIHEKGFWENRSIEYSFKMEDSLKEKLKQNSKIEAYSFRIHAGGLLSFKDTTQGALIQAIDPASEKLVSSIYKNIFKGGRYLIPEDRNNIIIGEILAKNLGVKVGNEVVMISQGFDGSIAAENLRLVGIFKTGNPEYDRNLMIMPIAQAKLTFSMMGYISSIVIRVKDFEYIEEVKEELKLVVDMKKIEILGWDELMPELVQFIVMDDFGAYIFDFILYLIVAFGILNTIQMAVFERIREFGVMLAIGTRPSQVKWMVIIESLFITVIGVFLGLILGSLLSYYFTINPIDAGQYADEMAVYGVSTTLFPAKLTLLNITVTAILIFILSFLFVIWPAKRASKFDPIQALRHL